MNLLKGIHLGFALSALTGLVMASQGEAADKCKGWTWSKGERARAQFALASQVCLNATRPSSEVVSAVKAVAGVNGYLLNVGVPLLTGEANLSSPAADSLDASAMLMVLGQKVWNPSVKQKTPHYEKTFTVLALDKELPYTVTLGPVTVNLQAGVRGEAGVDLNASAALAEVKGSLSPHVDTSSYALLQADAVLAKVGIQGDLIFAKGRGTLEGKSQILAQDKGVFLAGDMKVSYDITALKGSVKVYADPMEASLGDANSSHTWENILYSYEGFVFTGTAFEAKIPETLVFN